jgi:hypothetical protein
MQLNKKVVAAVVIVFLVLIISISVVIPYILQLLAPKVLVAYYGENVVPEGLTGFPSVMNQPFFYSWNLTLVNINNPVSGIGVPAERALQPLVAKYPQLVTMTVTDSTELTLFFEVTAFSGSMAEQCFVLFAGSQLSSDQMGNLTEDLNTQLAPALIEWYS